MMKSTINKRINILEAQAAERNKNTPTAFGIEAQKVIDERMQHLSSDDFVACLRMVAKFIHYTKQGKTLSYSDLTTDTERAAYQEMNLQCGMICERLEYGAL